MKIVIIGKNGQLGQALIESPTIKKEQVVCFSHEELDISDQKKVKEVLGQIKPNIIINTAAYHVLSMCEENPLEAFKINSVAVLNLAKIAKSINAKFVTYSTDYVFDGFKGDCYIESDKTNPLQMYGISKLAGEFSALSIYPENTIIIRTCGVYGGKEGSKSKKGNFILNIIKESSEKEMVEVGDDLIVNPTYAVDLAEATSKLLTQRVESGIYNLANEGYCSWYEFTKSIFTYAKIKVILKPVHRGSIGSGIRRPLFSALANTKAKSYGIYLPNWEDALKRYIATLE